MGFNKECGSDNICKSELSLGKIESTTENVIFGAENIVEAKTMLEVRGENAFGTFIFVNTTSKLNVAMLLYGASDQKTIPCRQIGKLSWTLLHLFSIRKKSKKLPYWKSCPPRPLPLEISLRYRS